jgi:hypothetical protein
MTYSLDGHAVGPLRALRALDGLAESYAHPRPSRVESTTVGRQPVHR